MGIETWVPVHCRSGAGSRGYVDCSNRQVQCSTLDLFEAIRHGTAFFTATAGSCEDFEAFVRVAEQHSLRPAIAQVFALKDLPAAVEFVERGGHLGKAVPKLDFQER